MNIQEIKPNKVSETKTKNPISWFGLVLVMLIHLIILTCFIYVQKNKPIELVSEVPMMVSFLDSPQQLVAEPKPVQFIEKPKPEPVKQNTIVVRKSAILIPDTPSPLEFEQENIKSTKQGFANPEISNSQPETSQPGNKSVQVFDKVMAKEDIVEPPKFGVAYLNNPAPNYPGMSRRTGEQGQVMLRVLVSATGEAASVELEKTSQYERLDQAAIEAVKKWRFVPAKKNNQPFSAYVLVPVRFSLDK